MTTKRQHLVWRKYLSSWTDTPETPYGKIFVYDKIELIFYVLSEKTKFYFLHQKLIL